MSAVGDVVRPQLRTRIWLEDAVPGHPGVTQAAYCHGYDVAGDLLGRAGWVEMLFLLLRGEAPDASQLRLLEALAVLLANPGPRDPAVHAAMCAGSTGSTAAATLMAALAVGAGQLGGAREVHAAVTAWQQLGRDLAGWQAACEARRGAAPGVASIWPRTEHVPGFDPTATALSPWIEAALERLVALGGGACLAWLLAHRAALEAAAQAPLAMTGVAAAALADLGFTPAQSEMLHLLLRLPGSVAHALEQQALGPKQFPFFDLDLVNDPFDREAA
ncbi:citryl-CoA lyase [Roseateles sp. NT4]|uniref:citryl-CoA lyase n=1 Tax=Roseateles sp. NT4 TaxID=3453715 RepID=UPI003EEEA55C